MRVSAKQAFEGDSAAPPDRRLNVPSYTREENKKIMLRPNNKSVALVALALTAALSVLLTPAPRGTAADHGDSPFVANDRGADIADTYIFRDPADNSRVVLAGTINGFIVPNEMVNFGVFDENLRYRFEIENTGDARPDLFIDVTFTPKQTANTQVQTATVALSTGQTFTAPGTVPNLNPTPPDPVITTDAATNIRFFAGVADDPFNFDIAAFGRYTAAQRACGPAFAADCTNAAKANLQRGRDSFAGYNILAIVFSIPEALVRGQGNTVGANFLAQRRSNQTVAKRSQSSGNRVTGFGRWVTVDRMATPAVNVALIPFNRKDEFNSATTLDDVNGRFAGSIVATLQALGTDQTSIGILAQIAVARGDFVRVDLTIPNTNVGQPDANGNRDAAGFPNGRRFGDDVVDTELFLINNRVPLTDNANLPDVPYRTVFPYIAPPHQPFPAGTIDDRTRN